MSTWRIVLVAGSGGTSAVCQSRPVGRRGTSVRRFPNIELAPSAQLDQPVGLGETRPPPTGPASSARWRTAPRSHSPFSPTWLEWQAIAAAFTSIVSEMSTQHVRLQRPRQVYRADLVGGAGFGEIMRVAGGRRDGVQNGPADHPVIPVVDVMLPEVDGRWVGCDHHIGPDVPHQRHQPAPQLQVVVELTVAKPQPVVGL